MSTPAWFLVWVAGTRGPETQRWAARPVSLGSDYWSEKSGRVVLVVSLSAEEFARPIDVIAQMYPAPSPKEGAVL